MGVVMKGGTSGDDHNYLASSPGHQAQPILDTANNSGMGPGVVFPSQNTGNREGPKDPGMPRGGSIPTSSTDVEDPGATSSTAAPKDIFKGSTDTPGL